MLHGAEGTFLHQCAAEGGSYNLCCALVDIGIPVNKQDAQGNTALHSAAKAGNLAVARALCERNADVTARNKHNRTPKMVVRQQLSLLPTMAVRTAVQLLHTFPPTAQLQSTHLPRSAKLASARKSKSTHEWHKFR